MMLEVWIRDAKPYDKGGCPDVLQKRRMPQAPSKGDFICQQYKCHEVEYVEWFGEGSRCVASVYISLGEEHYF